MYKASYDIIYKKYLIRALNMGLIIGIIRGLLRGGLQGVKDATFLTFYYNVFLLSSK